MREEERRSEGGVEKERGRTKGGERQGREIGERKEGERRSEGKTKKK